MRVARAFQRRLGVALEDGHLPAADGQRCSRRAAGQAGADDYRVAFGRRIARASEPGLIRNAAVSGSQAPAQNLAFVAVAGHPLHVEAGLDQAAPHKAGAGERAQRCVGRAKPGQLGEQHRLPHLRILRRGKAVEEPGIDLRIQARQAFEHVADQQGQHNAAASEDETLIARIQPHVLLQQLLRLLSQLWPQGQCALQVLAGQRVLFDADEVQPRLRVGYAPEQMPRTKKVQPGTEAGLTNHQALVVL